MCVAHHRTKRHRMVASSHGKRLVGLESRCTLRACILAAAFRRSWLRWGLALGSMRLRLLVSSHSQHLCDTCVGEACGKRTDRAA